MKYRVIETLDGRYRLQRSTFGLGGEGQWTDEESFDLKENALERLNSRVENARRKAEYQRDLANGVYTIKEVEV